MLQRFSLMGKDGPWKEVLAKHCRKALRSGSLRSLQSLQSKESPGQAYLDALIKMLQDAVLEVEQMDLQYWSANTGRNNLWYAGWRLMAWRYLKVFRDSSLHTMQSKTSPSTPHLLLICLLDFWASGCFIGCQIEDAIYFFLLLLGESSSFVGCFIFTTGFATMG